MDQQAREQYFVSALVTEHFVLQSARGGHYRTLLPEAEQFFDPPAQDAELASQLATIGLHRGPAALLFSGASTIAAVNSILGGVGVALLLAHSIGLNETGLTLIGVVSAVVLFGAHLAYEHRRSTTPDRRVAAQPGPGQS